MRLDTEKRVPAFQPFTEKMYSTEMSRAKRHHPGERARAAMDSFTPSAPRPAGATALMNTQAAAANGVWYTVQPGDTLTGIAQRYNTTVDAIVKANNIADPNRINVGQQLWIPQDNPPPPPPTPTTGTGTFTSTADANKVFLNQWGPTAYNNANGAPYGYNDCGPTSDAMVLEAVGLMPQAGAGGAEAAIDKVRDAVFGYDTQKSQLMDGYQLQAGLQRLGANATMLGGDVVSAVDQSLSNGHPAVIGGYGVWQAWGASQNANGNYLNHRDPGGHFVAVLGKDQNGQYIVGDPLNASGAITVNADQLRTFYRGGFGVLEVSNPNPPQTSNKASFQGADGEYMCAEGGGGGDVKVNRQVPREWETFNIIDKNGGNLESGDAINIQTNNGDYLCAEGGGGGALNATRTKAAEWETFRLVEVGGDGHIQDGDRVQLQTWDGQHWVCAERGGGDKAVADRTNPREWETFIYHKQ